MEINSGTKILGLFGNPSRHSFSPLIQNSFINHYGIDCVYLAFEPEVESLKPAFFGARDLGFIGLNITMPFKEMICKLLDKTEGPASIFKAVNTVKFLEKDRSSIGFSTDGDGVIKSLEDSGLSWEGKKCMIIGAGGAARSAIYSIINKPVETIYLFDIDINKSEMLLNIFKKHGKINVIKDINNIEKNFYKTIDLLINCSPAGMKINGVESDLLPVPKDWNLKKMTVFDMVYEPLNTPLIKKAESDGSDKIIKGIEMLINQAACSFRIWFDVMPEESLIKKTKDKIIKSWI